LKERKGYRCGLERAYYECCKKCDYFEECKVSTRLYWIFEKGE